MKIHELINSQTSQKSPVQYCKHFFCPPEDTYSSMFLDDIGQHFSNVLSPTGTDSPFYVIDEGKDKLYELLHSVYSYSFDYEFDQLLSYIVQDMAVYGKAFVEVVFTYNSKGEVNGIFFNKFNSILRLKSIRNTMFVMKPEYNKGLCFCQIPNKVIICFRCKDIGFSHRYFKSLFRKLGKLDSTKDALHLTQGSSSDFHSQYEKKQFKVLSTTKHIFWYGRNSTNPFMSEAYLLYRNVKLIRIQERLVQYCINKFNETLQHFSTELGFTGRLMINYRRHDLENEFQKMLEGKINIETLSNIVFPSTSPMNMKVFQKQTNSPSI